MLKNLVVLLIALLPIFSFSQVSIENELLNDSLKLTQTKEGDEINKGRILDLYWNGSTHLIDVVYLKNNEDGDASTYGIVLNTNVKDTLPFTIKRGELVKDELQANLAGKKLVLEPNRAYKFSFTNQDGDTKTLTVETNVVGFDKKIDLAFGDATNWFVELIFAQIPFGTVKDDLKFDLTQPGNFYKLKEMNDSVYVSNIIVKKRESTGVTSENSKVIPFGKGFKIAKADIPSNMMVTVTAEAVKINIYWVLIALIGGALFFTIYFGFVNIRRFPVSINIVRGKYDGIEESGRVDSSDTFPGSTKDEIEDNIKAVRIEGDHGDGEVSHFQALTAALSATVGLGNIAGVAIALSIGGPGATFWMIIAGLLGMSSKFVECTLGVKYREVDENGTVYGGPMYYLSKGLKQMKMSGLGKVLAVLFAIMCIGGSFGGGNMFQSNQAFNMFQSVTGGEQSFAYGYGWVFGLIMAVLVGIVIIGGIKSIAKVTDKIVPFMVGIYVLAAIIVLSMNASFIPDAFGEIFNGAFTGAGITGGAIGVLIQGFKRAAFSNEAGIGSASIAHSAVKTKHPASEGLVALLEPFIDTVLVCTMTALVIVITNMDGSVMQYGIEVDEGVRATSAAFSKEISWFPYVLAVAVILFAFSSMISWSYYGFQAWSYLFGKNKTTEYSYKLLFCVFTIVGAAASLGSVINFSDAMIFAMMVPNMIGLVLLSPKVREELKRYISLIKKVK